MSDTEDTAQSGQEDRYDQHIYDLDLGHTGDARQLEHTECEITERGLEHAGRPVFVFAIGPAGEDVRKAKVCTECGMVGEEVAFDASALVLEGMGGVRNRVTNRKDDEASVSVPLDDILDGVHDENGDPIRDRDLINTGINGDELIVTYLTESAAEGEEED